MKTSSNRHTGFADLLYTSRDVQIVDGIYMKKYLTTPQIHALYFPSSHNPKVAEQRMRLLRERGLVRSIEQAHKRGEGRKPFIWRITQKGAQLLAVERGIDVQTIDTRAWADEEYSLHIKHLLATTDMHIAIMRACTISGIRLESFIDERELRGVHKMEAVHITGPQGEEWDPPIPDALFTVQIDDKRAIFRLEVDRATVEIEPSLYEKRSIVGKVRKYLAFEASDY
jgi:hypothetical protein